jgi:hypothetical protein
MKEVRNSGFLRIIPLLITICSLSFPIYAKYSGGSGTADDPYRIATVEDLMLLGGSTADYDKHFILTADIDLDPNLPGRKVFDKAVIAPHRGPINYDFEGTAFSGLFDGNDHTISHLTIVGEKYIGLFGELVSAGKVMDLKIMDVNVIGSDRHVGSILGHSTGTVVGNNNGTVEACLASGSVSGKRNVGGLVGSNSGTISESSWTGLVIGDAYVGGLVGFNGKKITNCNASGSVISSSDTGGLVGANNSGTITSCYATSSVEAGGHSGGLVGSNTYGTIILCHATGSVSGKDWVGGLVASEHRGSISNSYATGDVSGRHWIGGLVGQAVGGDFTACYAMGAVSGRNSIGGLAGRSSQTTFTACYATGALRGEFDDIGGFEPESMLPSTSIFIACFWDIETSGHNTSVGGRGMTTEQMQTASVFLHAGWDFLNETANGTEDIWWILDGQDYPKLFWQSKHSLSFCPNPYNGEISVDQPLVLSWIAGARTTSHDIYFGEDVEAVTNATVENPGIYRGHQSVNVTTYDPGPLEWDKTYYWRVDEVNETERDSPWKGNVWSFTTNDFTSVAIVDDFEIYTDEEGSRIYENWIDGFNVATNGSQVGYTFAPYAEQTIVHSGQQSMPMDYNNVDEPWYSEAERMWEAPQDWTINEADTLTLYFQGEADNNPEPLYVSVEDSVGQIATLTHPDADAVQATKWRKWHISLADLKAQGVDVATVKKIYIGVGDRNNPQPGGTGRIYIDDILMTKRMQ